MGTNYGQLHPSQVELLTFFEYDHLPEFLQPVSRWFHDLAVYLTDPEVRDAVGGPEVNLEGPELTVALRKLLEAKDCAVRAALVAQRKGGE